MTRKLRDLPGAANVGKAKGKKTRSKVEDTSTQKGSPPAATQAASEPPLAENVSPQVKGLASPLTPATDEISEPEAENDSSEESLFEDPELNGSPEVHRFENSEAENGSPEVKLLSSPLAPTSNWIDYGLSEEDEKRVAKNGELWGSMYISTIDTFFEIATCIQILHDVHYGDGTQGSFASALIRYGYTARNGTDPIHEKVRSELKTLKEHEPAVRAWWATVPNC